MAHRVTAGPAFDLLVRAAGRWGAPPDLAAKVALGLAGVLVVGAVLGRGRSVLGLGPEDDVVPPRLFVALASFAAAMLSVFWIAHYLRGGPRIVDATTYFLQGRALAEGHFAWPVGEPSASFRGRFLLYRTTDGGVLGGIFPPGFPMLVAIGFGLGAPMIVGPLLAAGLVWATYRLARAMAEDAGVSPALAEPAARCAALLSVACAALRYHTADTMSHAASGLGITLALFLALGAARRGEAGSRGRALLIGLAVGAVVATRPFSAIGVGLVAAALVGRRGGRALAWLGLGLAPGVALLVLGQHAVTGAWLTSSQRMYYAMSDGPPGCFRWGFGAGTGCLFEHGDFVRARLASGFGPLEAAGTTLRRLQFHLGDVANFEPLALLALLPLVRLRGEGAPKRSVAAVAGLSLVALHVLAYAPFYFDGSYPGGGSRMLADVLPVEHALVAVALARVASRAPEGARGPRMLRAVYLVLALSLAGFGVHRAYAHEQLASRDGGHPMFEPDVLAEAKVDHGLVFVDTDHGFALGHDPRARVEDGVVVARLREDDRDRLLYEQLGSPPTYRYLFDVPAATAANPSPQATPQLVPYTPPGSGDSYRFEAEAEWPALAQDGGFAVPVWTELCASGSRALVLTPAPPSGRARATITIPVPRRGRYRVVVRIVQGTHAPHTAAAPAGVVPKGALRLRGLARDAVWSWVDVPGAKCAELEAREIELSPPRAEMVLEAEGGPIALDDLLVTKIPISGSR